MTDLEKALDAVAYGIRAAECAGDRIGRSHVVMMKTNDLDNILPLLKAQLPRLMPLGEVLAWAETPAEKRDPIFFEQKKGKGPSGWICNSLCPKDYYLCCLDEVARCWTSRPTDEQREEIPWN